MSLPRGFLWTFIVVVTFSSSNGKCPVTCHSMSQRKGCNCKSGYWNRIPDLSPDIRQLVMWNSNLTYLPSGAFRTSPNLTVIKLVKDNIHTIADHAFDGLNQLIRLSLTANKVKHLSEDSLSGLSQLQTINLNSNLLPLLPGEALCVLENLRTLSITDNKMYNLHFGECFKNLTRLISLKLSGNVFPKLSYGNFAGLCTVRIRELFIESCQIRELSSDVFECLNELQVLSMKNNHIRFLHNDTFKGLKMLIDLNIIGNPIAAFSSKLFAPLANLQILSIGSRKSTSLMFGSEFQNLKLLHTLHLKELRLKALKNDTFRSLVACPIQVLILEECIFRTVESGSLSHFPKLIRLRLQLTRFSNGLLRVLAELRSPDLTSLVVNGGGRPIYIKGVEHIGSILQAPNLSELSLKYCRLKTISRTLLGNFSNLRILDISSNFITHADEGSMRLLTKLDSLKLNGNRFSLCPSGAWLGIGNSLKRLLLQDNFIQSVYTTSLVGYGTLEILDLSTNSIRKFHGEPFQQVPRLKLLNLSGNKIATLGYIGLPRSLQLLTLYSNNLQSIAENAFANLTKLRGLILSRNTIIGRNVNSWKHALSGLHNLERLSLIGLGMPRIPAGLLSNLTNLRVLSLAGNTISSWELRTFAPLKKLTTLSLSNNKITLLNEESFRYISDTLEEIDLAGNPFACTCDLLWFRHYMMTGNVFFISLSEGRSYACASPESLREVPLLKFHILPYDCINKMEIGAAFGVFFTCVILGIAGSFVLRYWWHLRYYWFLLQARRKRQKELLHQPQYRFDAFVCYHRDDRHWVIRNLLPNIEYDGGYAVCLHDRNWLGGVDIAENILMSIERSRKVILVLTNKFAASQWCQFEVAMAQHRLLDEGRDVLVPVLIEDIEGRNLTARLRHVLQTKTYLAWPREVNKEAKFWNALKKALKKRRPIIDYAINAVRE